MRKKTVLYYLERIGMVFSVALAGASIAPTSVVAQSQQPDFRAQISYDLIVERSYEMTADYQQNCLSLYELSVYSPYKQVLKERKQITNDGYLVSEREYVYEEGVRDEWMQNIKRIFVHKDSTVLFDEKGTILHVSYNEENDDNSLSIEETYFFDRYEFGEPFLNTLKESLIAEEIPFTEENQIISFQVDQYHWVYDHNLKLIMESQFNEAGEKIKEKIIEYKESGDGTYHPLFETEFKWILSENGCCIRVRTARSYINYERLVDIEASIGLISGKEPDSEKELGSEGLIQASENQNIITINSVSETGGVFVSIDQEVISEYEVRVFDVTGSLVISKAISGSQHIELPSSARQGVYLVHVVSKENNHFKVGKVILSNSN